MGECVFIYGKSGSGKSRSLKNFGENEICLINFMNKRLPFEKDFKYVSKSQDVDTIIKVLNDMTTDVAVIDDAGYIMTNLFMMKHGGSDGFKMYNEIADTMYKLVYHIKQLNDNKIVYIILHEDVNDRGDSKFQTIGKLLDQKVCLEGCVTVVLRCMVRGGQHIFLTNSDGSDICKSPEGMFEMEIENDLKAVDKRIREFWKIGKSAGGK